MNRKDLDKTLELGIPPGEQLLVEGRAGTDCMFVVTRTNRRVSHTGRPLYLVACLTCRTLLHQATTSATAQIDDHDGVVHARRREVFR